MDKANLLTWLGCTCFVGLPFLTGCGQTQNPIVGKWQSIANSAQTVEFFADGTFRSDSVTGTYQFPDNAHIVLVPGAGQMYASFKSIRLKGDTLTFTDTDFRRAKPKAETLHRIND